MTKETSMTTAALRAALQGENGTARQRLTALFDEGTFVEVGAYIGRKRTELDVEKDDSFEPVLTGYGAVDGSLVFAFSQDFSRMSGALGEMHAKKIVKIIEMAGKAGAPLVGVFDSAGAKILEGVDALAGYGSIMRAVAAADIPKIAVICGVCGGASSVIAEQFDLVIAAKSGKLFTAPSGKVGEEVAADMKQVDILAENDAEAMAKTRSMIALLTYSLGANDDMNRKVDVENILDSENYDMKAVIETVFDLGSFTEVGAHYGESMCTGFATMNGRTVAVVATNPANKDGMLCPCAADKATRLLTVAAAAGIPAVTLVDSVGVADKPHAEEKGIAKKLSDLATAYTKFYGSAVTVTLGRSFGTAYTVLGSKALTDGVALALDRAEISAMSPESAVAFLDAVDDESRHSEIAKEWAAKYASPLQAAKSGHIDDIISADELRQRIGSALEMLL